MNELDGKEAQELSKEEINVYATDCGEIQKRYDKEGAALL